MIPTRASRVFLLGLLGAAGLSACATYKPKPLTAEQVAGDFSARTLTAVSLKDFLESNLHQPLSEWPLAKWDLPNLVFAAFYYHPDLDVARARWAVAEAAKITAGERPNPTLNLTPGYDTTRSIPSPWLPLTWLDIPIETAGKRGYRVQQATQLSEVARLGILSVAWQVRSRVRSSLVEFCSARQAETLLDEQQTIQVENVELLGRQYQAGFISAFELTQGRIGSDATRLALDEAKRQSAEAHVQLADAVGIPVGALEGVEVSFAGLDSTPEGATLEDTRRRALLNRADVLGLLAEYSASQAALQLEIAKQYPDLHIGPGYQYDQGENKWSLGLTVTLPVFNQNQGGIAEAEARRSQAAAAFNALQARVVAEIDRAVAGYETAVRKKSDADAMLANLQKQEMTAQGMFAAGEISKSELDGLRLQLVASRLARLEALTKSQQALGALEDAVQSPLGLPTTLWESAPRVAETGHEDENP